jgi:putative tryptophan/tyrosine transport system substrate-binding protein
MRFSKLGRRELITLIGGAAATWPLAVHAQQGERVRRIGVLMNLTADDPEGPPRTAAFVQALQQLGWTVGRNVQIDYRWGAGDADRYRKYAVELIALVPDVIVASNTSTVRALKRTTRTTPIVFTSAVDPVGGGLVGSLAHPGGNITGFSAFEFGLSGKWLELLKEVAPSVTRAVVLRDSTTTGGTGQFGAIQAGAPTVGIEVSPVDLHDAGEIERVITSFAREPNGGMVVVSGALAGVHRDLIIKLAAQYRLPAVYPYRFFVVGGGLISYGPARVDPRILKGEKQAPLRRRAPR